jgi:hypothetical protein
MPVTAHAMTTAMPSGLMTAAAAVAITTAGETAAYRAEPE